MTNGKTAEAIAAILDRLDRIEKDLGCVPVVQQRRHELETITKAGKRTTITNMQGADRQRALADLPEHQLVALLREARPHVAAAIVIEAPNAETRDRYRQHCYSDATDLIDLHEVGRGERYMTLRMANRQRSWIRSVSISLTDAQAQTIDSFDELRPRLVGSLGNHKLELPSIRGDQPIELSENALRTLRLLDADLEGEIMHGTVIVEPVSEARSKDLFLSKRRRERGSAL